MLPWQMTDEARAAVARANASIDEASYRHRIKPLDVAPLVVDNAPDVADAVPGAGSAPNIDLQMQTGPAVGQSNQIAARMGLNETSLGGE